VEDNMNQDDNLDLEVQFTFWPSVQEIRESKSTDLYVGGLKEHLDSLTELEGKLANAHLYAKRAGDAFRAGLYPETLLSFGLFIGSTGIAAGLYNLLKTWVDSKNGRKIRIKIGALEVETTQMSEEKFLKFLKDLKEFETTQMGTNDIKERSEIGKRFEEHVQNSGHKVLQVDTEEYASEKVRVTSEALESIWRIRDSD
jgi:hypothetical protein